MVSGKDHDNKHLTLRLLLPATGSNSRWETCSWDNNNQAYQGTKALCALRVVAKQTILLQVKTIFILLLIPHPLPGATVAAAARESSTNTTSCFLQFKLQPTKHVPQLCQGERSNGDLHQEVPPAEPELSPCKAEPGGSI